ncbi:hypothetical protein VI817_000007 [Penicillium citrinum]|nr:hypothetical protein VI817_000007 [Penicillium citrinum]
MKPSVDVAVLAALFGQVYAVLPHERYLIQSVENEYFLQVGGHYLNGDDEFVPESKLIREGFNFDRTDSKYGDIYRVRVFRPHLDGSTTFPPYIDCYPPKNGTVCHTTIDINSSLSVELINLDGQYVFSDPESGLVLRNANNVLVLSFPTGGKDERFLLEKSPFLA